MNKYQKAILAFCLLIFYSITLQADNNNDILDAYPHVVITNGIIETSIFLPDARNGFYRSSRYDWSGMNWQLTYNGHNYFMLRKSQNPHEPEITGHGASLAEEFSIGTSIHIPQRYNAAKPGETFMKIAVGNLVKPDDNKKYHFATQYKIVDSGKWEVSYGKDRVEFTHELSDPYGYGYRYVKLMELTSGKPELVISHSLKNTGTKTLIADQYCHNFFTIDYDTIGDAYQIELFFPAKFINDLNPNAVIKDNKIIILKDLEGGIFSVMEGYDSSVSHNHCIIRNTRTKAGVDIKGDFPLSGFNFYADTSAICPEFFVGISIEPGETRKWSRTYNFFEE